MTVSYYNCPTFSVHKVVLIFLLSRNTQIQVPGIWSSAMAKQFTGIVEFKEFLKIGFLIFSFLKRVFANKYWWLLVPVSRHSIIKYFTETIKFKKFRRTTLPHISFLKMASYFLLLSLILQLWNISIKFRELNKFFKMVV